MIEMFADDTKIYREVKGEEGISGNSKQTLTTYNSGQKSGYSASMPESVKQCTLAVEISNMVTLWTVIPSWRQLKRKI